MKTILIAEDDKFYSSTLSLKLSKEGYQTIIAADGEKTMEAVKNKKPDLILLDLVMPIMDGFEVLEALKSNTNFKDIKIVVLSNLGQDEDRKKAMDMGAFDYLVKTNLSIQQMVDKVGEYVK